MAKLETLVDNFSGGLTNWEYWPPGGGTYPLWSAVSGHVEGDISTVAAYSMQPTSTYSVQDTWWSIELTDFYFPSVSNDYLFSCYIVDDPFSTIPYNATFQYHKASDMFVIGDSVGNSVTISPPGGTVTLGWRDDQTAGAFTFSYSLDSGTTWHEIGTVFTFLPTGTQWVPLFLGQASDTSTAQDIKFDNFNVYAPDPVGAPGFNVPVASATVRMGDIAIPLVQKKIETLVDDFSGGLGNWGDSTTAWGSYGFNPMYNLVSGHIEIDGASNGTGDMHTADGYTFQNTWYSIEVTDYYFPTVTANYTILQGTIFNRNGTPAANGFFQMFYDQAHDMIGFIGGDVFSEYTLGEIAIPGGTGTPIVMGWSESGGTSYYYYSLDSGSTWTPLGSHANSIDEFDKQLDLLTQGSADAITQLVKLDNFNVYQPPGGALSFSVPVAAATVTVPGILLAQSGPAAHLTVRVNPTITIIFNDIHAVDRSASVPATLTATVPLTGASVTLGLKVDISAGIGRATITGIPYTSITYGPPTLSVGPGMVFAVAKAPTISLTEGVLHVSVPTASVAAECGNHIVVIVGSFIIGDHAYYPLTIRDSGSATYVGATYNGDDAGDYAPGGHTFTNPNAMIWLYYQADAPEDVTFTWSGSPIYYAWVFTGDSYTDGWTPLAQLGYSDLGDSGPYTAGNSVTLSLNTGLTRIAFGFPSSLGSPYDTMTLTWSYVPTYTGLLMDIANPVLDRTPDNLQVSVLGGAPSEYLKFEWSPPASTLIPSSTPRAITLATIKSDSEGNLLTGTIPLPAVFHGTYQLVCIGQQSGKIALANFEILNDPLPQDSDSTDTDPVAQLDEKWLWDDALGHTWSMEINPTTATKVVFPKNLTADHSTSGTGQHIVWQGITPAIDWSFTGTVLSQGDYEQFEYFLSLNRKFYITNHRGKTYIVTLKSFDPKPHKAGDNFWAFDYTVAAILYGTKGGD